MVSICGQPGGVAYPASKYAVNGLTWSLARELGPFNIRVNAVAPGITKTDMVAALPDEVIQPMINAIPLRRIGESEDIANAFLYLASDLASYVTGEILSVFGRIAEKHGDSGKNHCPFIVEIYFEKSICLFDLILIPPISWRYPIDIFECT